MGIIGDHSKHKMYEWVLFLEFARRQNKMRQILPLLTQSIAIYYTQPNKPYHSLFHN